MRSKKSEGRSKHSFLSRKLENKKFIFFFIILIAAFFRLYRLDSVPPGPSLDEVSIGYNAYSILKTGADEYGTKFPMVLRAYDDWRPAMHVYLSIPFVAAFGLNVFSVRLPAVILSILTVLATYFLTKEIFGLNSKFEMFRNTKLPSAERNSKQMSNSKKENSKYFGLLTSNFELVALLSAFLLAISPWHIYISRLGHEVNAGLAFLVFAILFFLKKRIYLSGVFMALSFMSYHPEKIIIPVFLVVIFLLFRKEIFEMKKKIMFTLVIAIIIVIPFMRETLSPNGLIRLRATNIYTANQERFIEQSKRLSEAFETNNVFEQIVYNRRVLATQIFAENYISHFNPKWLFTNLGMDRHKVPSLGLLYKWEIPFIVLGLFIFFKPFNQKIKILIAVWILSSPLAAALTTDAPHAMRTFTMLPMPQILASIGIFYLYHKTRKLILREKLAKATTILIIFIIAFISTKELFSQYFYIFPKTQSSSFQYALFQSLPYVQSLERNYEKIIFSNSDNLYQSYMYFLFYNRYDPRLYQKQGGTKSGGYAETHKFGKYEFRPIDWKSEKKDKSILYVGNVEDFQPDAHALSTFRYLNGVEGVKVVDGG